MEIGYRQRGPQGNPGLDRFMASGRESREGGQQNLRTIGEMYKFYNQKEGGLFGRYGTQETKPQFANLTEAIGARGTDPNAASLVKSAYEGIDPGDWTKAKSQYILLSIIPLSSNPYLANAPIGSHGGKSFAS